MKNTIVKHKWFWAWQDDKEEQWLNDMSNKGYHLVKPEFFGRYEFTRGQPRNYVYRLDFMIGKKDQKEIYLQYFLDAGWEYLGEFGSWQYFRILVEGDTEPEIYTDAASKIKKYQRISGLLVVLLLIYLMVLSVNNLADSDPAWLIVCIFIIWLSIISLFVFSIVKLFLRIQELKKTIKQ